MPDLHLTTWLTDHLGADPFGLEAWRLSEALLDFAQVELGYPPEDALIFEGQMIEVYL